jgi:hypothetical protein
MLREHRANETELGKQAAEYMANGDLVPDELVIEMIMSEIEDKGDDGFLLDGFPRSVGQADALAGRGRAQRPAADRRAADLRRRRGRAAAHHRPARVLERPRLPRGERPAEARGRLRSVR